MGSGMGRTIALLLAVLTIISGAVAIAPPAAAAPGTLSVEITAPQQNEYLPVSYALVTWVASDSTYDISRFQVFVDDPSFSSPQDTTAQQMNVSGLADGQHTLVVRAYNIVGGFAQAAVLFHIDTLAPALRIVSPVDGAWSNSSAITVEWEASSSTSIAYFEARVDTEPWISPIPYDQMSNTFQNVSNGAHNVTVMAHGWGGRTSTAAVAFNVDNTIPAVNITNPGDDKGFNHADITVVWSGTDAGNNIVGYQIWVDGVRVTTAIPAENNFNYNYIDGTHTVRIVAIDIASSTAADEVTFLVDTVLPTVVARSPEGDQQPLDVPIWVNFSKPMDPLSSLTIDGIPGTMKWEGNMLLFTPSSTLAYATPYGVTLDARDLVGNVVQQKWTFTTTDMGTISGTVIDEGGKPVPGVSVALDGGEVEVTNDQGEFTHRAHAGIHNLTMSKLGWDGRTVMVNLQPGQMLTLGSVAVSPSNPLATYGVVAAVAAVVVVGLLYVAGKRRKARRETQHRSMRGLEGMQQRSKKGKGRDGDGEDGYL
jgi:hypothetical protein